MGKRGELTDKVQEVAEKLMGRKISVRELRLMPYIQYTMMNSQRIRYNHINQEERDVLSMWNEQGYVEGGDSDIFITKEFWDIMGEILFYGYVDIDRT